ncbi:hypothetical protein fh0823_21940 [Francisella halioticida]|nr:hypothetical protein fh0823_21940 [Francisella halioticida]
MRFILKILINFLLFCSLFTVGDSTNKQVHKGESNINNILVLQQEIFSLKQQINQVKKSQSTAENITSKSDFATYSSKILSTPTPILKPVSVDYETKYIVTKVSSNDYLDKDLHEPQKNEGAFFSNGSIDVGGEPAVTTQGQITYLGLYSGNNTIPIGQISRNLFSSTIIGQKDKFGEYSMFFGGYLEADAQTWFGSQIK